MQKRFFGLRNSLLFLSLLSTPYCIFYVLMGSFVPSVYGVAFAALCLAGLIALMISEIRDTNSSYSGKIRETGKAKIVGYYMFTGFFYSFFCIYGATNFVHQIVSGETLEAAVALNSKATRKVSPFCRFQIMLTPLAKNGGEHIYCGSLEDSLTINRSSEFDGGRLVAVVSKQSFLGHSFGHIKDRSLLGDKLQKAIDGEATMPFCNQKTWTLPVNASVYEWHNVDGSRLREERYLDKVSELEILLNGKTQYIYKILLGIGGVASHQSLILSDEPITVIDIKDLHEKTKQQTDADAKNSAITHKTTHLTKLIFNEAKEKTTPWVLDERVYITTEGVRRYVIYGLEKDGLHKVCSATRLDLQS